MIPMAVVIKGGSMASDQSIQVTVFLRHDQSKTLHEIRAHTKETGFYRDFPPEGVELISWSTVMSFGFVMHLKVEPGALRNLNRFMEEKAWGAFRYECHPSYDFIAIAEQMKQEDK
jgi:hypothetical protein